MHNITIENKVVLITGAFGLIGKTISINFLHQGAKVILADIDQTKAENISEELKTLNPLNYLIIPLDITNENSCEKALEESVKKFGKIDVLINNAALDAKFDKQNISEINHSRFENYPLELFKKSVDVNITGTVLVTQVMIRQMLKQGYGNIINVASTYSLVSPNQKLYDFGDGTIQYKPVDYISWHF